MGSLSTDRSNSGLIWWPAGSSGWTIQVLAVEYFEDGRTLCRARWGGTGCVAAHLTGIDKTSNTIVGGNKEGNSETERPTPSDTGRPKGRTSDGLSVGQELKTKKQSKETITRRIRWIVALLFCGLRCKGLVVWECRLPRWFGASQHQWKPEWHGSNRRNRQSQSSLCQRRESIPKERNTFYIPKLKRFWQTWVLF